MTKTQRALPSLSFEFFPPHSPEAGRRLWRSVERLAPLAPQFVSVTYGAGGTTRDRTNAAIQTILGRARLNVAGHLTCVGASRSTERHSLRLASGECGGKNSNDRPGRAFWVVVMCTGPYRQ
jgi:5,10-methylenetetrahydrofolate reductase